MNADVESSYFVINFILIILLGFSVFTIYCLRKRLIIGRPVTDHDSATTFQTSRECSEYSIVDIDWPVSISAGTRVISGVIDNITWKALSHQESFLLELIKESFFFLHPHFPNWKKSYGGKNLTCISHMKNESSF